MCGICGIVNPFIDKIDEGRVKAMSNRLKHRGPDDEGIYSNKGVCLGHRRLSIIDLSSAGHQPLANEDKTIWVVLNGEIYNYKELRVELEAKGHRFFSNSDTEVLVHLYEEKGTSCVKDLIGMFAFGIWDERKRQLLLARDRIGKKPLLYFYKDGNFCFASEFTALLESGFIGKEINLEAFDYYMTFGYIPAPLTIYKDIYKLKPAHTLLFKDGDIYIERYWSLDYEKKVSMSQGRIEEKLLDILLDATKRRLYSDVPLGVFLSGGIDSSTVVALMSKVYNQRIKTFSIGFEENNYNELSFARNIARHFNTEHKEFIVKPKALEALPFLIEHYGEPYADPSAIPTYYVSKISKEYVTVVLNGDGGDEVFGGYDRYQAMYYSQYVTKFIAVSLLKIIPASHTKRNALGKIRRFLEAVELPLHKRYAKWVGIFDDSLKEDIYDNDLKKDVQNFSATGFFEDCLVKEKRLSLLDSLLKLDSLTYLPDDLLVKVDIASMANALEVRSPFLDHRVMEFAASLPPYLKIRYFTKKYILKKIARRFIPKENIDRPKRGFGVPIGEWFRGELKDYLCDHLLDISFLKRGFYNFSKVKNMVESHMSLKKDYSYQLWTLLMFDLWYRRFMESKI